MNNPAPPTSRRFQLRICDGPSCGVTHESERLVEAVQAAIDGDADLKARVAVCSYTCYGRCDDGPNMFVHEIADEDERYEDPDDDVLSEQRGFYPGLTEEKLLRILRQHCGKGEVAEDLVDEY